MIAIFPEGRASDAPHLLPVKTGAARIALGARAAGPRAVDPARGADVRGQGVGAVTRLRADRTAARPRRGDPATVARRAIDDRRPRCRRGAHRGDRRPTLAGRARFRRCGRARRPRARGRGRAPPTGGAWAGRSARSGGLARRLADAPGAPTWSSAAGAYRQALEAQRRDRRAVASPPERRLPADPCRRDRGHAGAPSRSPSWARSSTRARRSPCTWPGDRRMAPVTRATSKFLHGDRPLPAHLDRVALPGVRRPARHPWLWTVAAGPVCGLAALWVADRVRRAWRARLRPARGSRPRAGARTSSARRRAGVIEAVEQRWPGCPVRRDDRVTVSVPAGSLTD